MKCLEEKKNKNIAIYKKVLNTKTQGKKVKIEKNIKKKNLRIHFVEWDDLNQQKKWNKTRKCRSCRPSRWCSELFKY